LIAIRRARPSDAPGIAAVHVTTWRSTYAGILPDDYLARMSEARQASYMDRAIRLGGGIYVASASGPDSPAAARVVGFATARRTNRLSVAEGEVETLYVHDDFRERGLGRSLLRAAGQHLSALGCRSAFAWVLRDNPATFFYEHLGGKRMATSTTHVAGSELPQTAYAWDPIELLLDVDA